jgi:hypothetical protein
MMDSERNTNHLCHFAGVALPCRAKVAAHVEITIVFYDQQRRSSAVYNRTFLSWLLPLTQKTTACHLLHLLLHWHLLPLPLLLLLLLLRLLPLPEGQRLVLPLRLLLLLLPPSSPSHKTLAVGSCLTVPYQPA